jgi:hypothetical protein
MKVARRESTLTRLYSADFDAGEREGAYRIDGAEASNTHIDPRINIEAWTPHFNHAGWWAFPFGWRYDSGKIAAFYAVRLMPGRVIEECPTVQIGSYEGAIDAFTLASRPAVTVAVATLFAMFRTDYCWGHIAKLDESAWASLIRFDKALGGSGDLSALRALARERKSRKVIVGWAHDELWHRTYESMVTRLDPSPDHLVYRGYQRRAAVENDAPVPLPEAGPWAPALAAIAFLVNKQKDARDAELAAAWALAQEPPYLDVCRVDCAPFPFHRGAAGELPLEAAKTVLRRAAVAPGEWKKDPLWPAVAALAKRGQSYDGAAHVETADAFAKSGEPERAWSALTAAAFWNASNGRSKRRTNGRIFDKAKALSKKAGWVEISERLSKMEELGRER